MQVPICLFVCFCFAKETTEKKRVILAGCENTRLLFNFCTFARVYVFLLLDYCALLFFGKKNLLFYLALHTKQLKRLDMAQKNKHKKTKEVHPALVDFWHCFLVLYQSWVSSIYS